MKLHAAFALGLLLSCCCSTPAGAFLLRSSQPRLAALPVPGGMSIRRGPGAGLSPAFAQIKAPADAYEGAVALGANKAKSTVGKTLALSIVAGLQLGIGSAMTVSTLTGLGGIQAQNPALAKIIAGLIGLPCGLLMTAVSGVELFTGNTALVGMAFLERQATTKQLAKNWIVSYLGNIVGTAALALLCQRALVFSPATSAGIAAIAATKASLPFSVAFVRGIVCNWLVTTAIFLASACSDLASKYAVIASIITIFVTLGFEHSVANMFIGPFAAMNGGPSYLSFFLRNLVPVTLGNIVGGFGLVALTNFLAFSKSKRTQQQ